MYQREVYEAAEARIQARRLAAKAEQERRTEQIRREIPETAELNRHLQGACLAILRAANSPGSEAVGERIRRIEQRCSDAETMLRQILAAHGYPEDYLSLHYSCTKCSDTGFVNGYPCDCLKREIGKVGAEKLNAQSQLSLCSFETFSLHYYKNLPEPQYRAMQQIYYRCRDYAEHFDPNTSESILMIGQVGLGKTHLSLSIANELLKRGFSVIYDSMGALMLRLDNEKFRGGNTDDSLSLILDCDLLILDDFGTEFDTKFSRSMVYTILNSRINSRKPFIINTNYTLDQINENYGYRVLSRLVPSNILQFYGEDIRSQKTAEKINNNKEATQ
ncbi:MAG: ATP-binding protein [Oscillospiraceae bacterium]|nr:ATP-binding protein [Oscillospiraceae bacterium]